LITYLVPPSILFIPLYAQIRTMGLADSLAGLVAAYPSFTVPFVTWLLMGYFGSIPEELEEAAMIDGATRFGAFRRIILPLAAPGVLAAGLFAFTQAWNEFLYALVFISDVKQRTLPVGLSTFITGDVYGWGYLMRGAMVGERKQVTVLFADLKGSMELLGDRDPEEARRLLDAVLERMIEAVHRYEGTVNQVMGDGIMALFGAPLAHEDHAVRACYA